MSSFFCRLCGGSNIKKREHQAAESFPVMEKLIVEQRSKSVSSDEQEEQFESEGLAKFTVRAFDGVDVPCVKSPDSDTDMEEDECNEYLDRVNELYESMKLFEAAEVVEQWKQDQGEWATMDYAIAARVIEEVNDWLAWISIINDNSDWIVDSASSKKIQVRYKKVPNSPTLMIKIEGVMKAPIENILGLLYENDLFYQWVPLTKKSDTIQELSRTQKVVRNEYSAPIPFFKNRECLIYAYGVNALNSKHKCILAVGRSVEGEKFKGITIPEPAPNTIRAAVCIVGATIEPLENGMVNFRFVSNFDPKVKALPYSMLNFFSRKFAKSLFKKIEKKANRMEGTEHERRRSDPQKRAFYDLLKETLIEYVPR